MRSLLLLFILSPFLSAGDFPGWRGPLRNGVIPDSPPLLTALPESGLRELWESETIPSNDEGGLSSPIVAGDRVYLSLVWHRDVPAESRQIDELVLRQLGHQPLNALRPEIVKRVEETRLTLAPTLRGKKLDAFTDEFIAAHLDKKERQLYSGWVSKRFAKGKFALPLEVLDTLDKHKSHTFATEAEMRNWLTAQGWSEDIRQQIITAVPPTRREAEDTLLCLDAKTGKTLWKTALPGEPLGRGASATPLIREGRLYAIGSRRTWCVEAATGKLLWEAPLSKRAIGSSPLLVDGLLIINAEQLIALDAATGTQRWVQKAAGGGNASPMPWQHEGKTIILCNGRELTATDAATGALLWKADAGGDSTPVLSGDILVVQSRKAELGLVAYRLSTDAPQQVWHMPIPEVLRTQSSPIIHDGHVYLMDDNMHYCVALLTGALAWKAQSPSTISSPVLADGKIFIMANNGNTLLMLAATHTERRELGKATLRSQWIPSPCIAQGRLILRMKDRIKAWSLLAP